MGPQLNPQRESPTLMLPSPCPSQSVVITASQLYCPIQFKLDCSSLPYSVDTAVIGEIGVAISTVVVALDACLLWAQPLRGLPVSTRLSASPVRGRTVPILSQFSAIEEEPSRRLGEEGSALVSERFLIRTIGTGASSFRFARVLAVEEGCSHSSSFNLLAPRQRRSSIDPLTGDHQGWTLITIFLLGTQNIRDLGLPLLLSSDRDMTRAS
jgi:hypothetical protein